MLKIYMLYQAANTSLFENLYYSYILYIYSSRKKKEKVTSKKGPSKFVINP